MGELVNLRRARKAKARLEDGRLAAQNREQFGRSKKARRLAAAESERARRELDAKKLD